MGPICSASASVKSEFRGLLPESISDDLVSEMEWQRYELPVWVTQSGRFKLEDNHDLFIRVMVHRDVIWAATSVMLPP
jgi:hypothetical protein